MGRDVLKPKVGNQCAQTVYREVGPRPHSGVYWPSCHARPVRVGSVLVWSSRQHTSSAVYVGSLKSISNIIKLASGENNFIYFSQLPVNIPRFPAVEIYMAGDLNLHGDIQQHNHCCYYCYYY